MRDTQEAEQRSMTLSKMKTFGPMPMVNRISRMADDSTATRHSWRRLRDEIG